MLSPTLRRGRRHRPVPECPGWARRLRPGRARCAPFCPGRPPAPHSQRRSHFIQWYTMVLWCRLFSRHHEERPWIDSIVLVTACSFLSSEASSAPAADEAAAAEEEEEDEEARPPPPPPAAIFPRCSRPGRAGGGGAAPHGVAGPGTGPGGAHGPGNRRGPGVLGRCQKRREAVPAGENRSGRAVPKAVPARRDRGAPGVSGWCRRRSRPAAVPVPEAVTARPPPRAPPAPPPPFCDSRTRAGRARARPAPAAPARAPAPPGKMAAPPHNRSSPPPTPRLHGREGAESAGTARG